MNAKVKFRGKTTIILILISYFIFGRALTYFSSTDVFISIANQIHFSINHLCNYISILFYIIQLIIYCFLFKSDIIDNNNYHITSINKKPKKLISILIICFVVFALLASSYSIPIGTKFNNSIIGSVVSFILIVLFAPIVEELFFRVILMKKLKIYYRFSITKLILIQAILFYIPHLVNGNYTFYTFYLGIVSGIFFYYTGSIIHSIILHSFANCAYFLFTLNIINYRLPITKPIWFAFFVLLFVFFYFMLRKIVILLRSDETIAVISN